MSDTLDNPKLDDDPGSNTQKDPTTGSAATIP